VNFYGRETWVFTLREEHKLKVFENRALSRIIGPNGRLEKIANRGASQFALLVKYN
jgi:hypothetical protein